MQHPRLSLPAWPPDCRRSCTRRWLNWKRCPSAPATGHADAALSLAARLAGPRAHPGRRGTIRPDCRSHCRQPVLVNHASRADQPHRCRAPRYAGPAQPSRLRRLRWQLGLAALVLVLLVPLTAFLRGDNTIYQSGTLSMSHQFIAHDCSRCHDTPGQTAWRAFNASATSVSQQACLACHVGPAHHAAKFSARKCGDCHREHAGPGRLSHVVSGFCTETQADLPSGASFAQSIKNFRRTLSSRSCGARTDRSEPNTTCCNWPKRLQPRAVGGTRPPSR